MRGEQSLDEGDYVRETNVSDLLLAEDSVDEPVEFELPQPATRYQAAMGIKVRAILTPSIRMFTHG